MISRLALRTSLVALAATVVTWIGTPTYFGGADAQGCGASFAPLGAAACADLLLWSPGPADQIAAKNRSARPYGAGPELTPGPRTQTGRVHWRAVPSLLAPASRGAELSSSSALDVLVASGKTDLPPPLA